MTTPSAIDYTARDYAGLRESMLAYAQTVAPDWSGARTGDLNDFGVMLVELFAYEGDILSYYGDRIANESFLSTATQRGSVLSHAALLDYTPRSATSATVPLTFTVTSTVPVVIPAGFEVQTSPDGVNDQLTFETDSDLYIPGSGAAITLSVPATEGNVVDDEIVATSCGDLDAQYTLQQSPVVAESLELRVVEESSGDGLVWFLVNNLLDAGPNDLAYAISMDENEALTVLFGDGVNGRVPPRGAVVHAKYRVGGGIDGNVLVNTITEVVDAGDVVYLPPIDPSTGQPSTTLPPVVPSTPVVIEVTNQTEASGGTDAESLESIRTNAPRALRAHDRAITLSDFEALALSVPTVQIAKAKAVASVYTNITLYVAPPGGTQPDQATLNAVVAYLQPRKLANVTVVAANPQYVSIDVALEITVDNRYAQLPVRQAVNNALTEFLAFANVNFGGRIALSDIYTLVSRIPGVSFVVVSKLARNRLTGATDVVLRDNELPIGGSFSLVASGGVVNSSGTEGDVIGVGTGTAPTAGGSPVLTLVRCDPNSTHVELQWTPGTDTTFWDVVVSYHDASGAEVERTVIGPFDREAAVLDLQLIGAGRAASMVFSTNAFNGAIGPVGSPTTEVPYTCEGAPAPTTGGGGAPPPPTTRNAPADLAWQPITVGPSDGGSDRATITYGVVNWTTPANPPTTAWRFNYRFLDSSNAVLGGGQASGPQYVGTTSRNVNSQGVPGAADKIEFWLQVIEDDGSFGAESNHAIANVPLYTSGGFTQSAPNAPVFDSFTYDSGTSSVSMTVHDTSSDSTTTDVIYKELVYDSSGTLLYTSSIGSAPVGGTLALTRALSSSFGGTPAFYEIQAAAFSGGAVASPYSASSVRQTLSGGSGGHPPAGLPTGLSVTNLTRTGPVSSEFTVTFDVVVTLAAPTDQVAVHTTWQPTGYTDTNVINTGPGTFTYHYTQQYTDADDFTGVDVYVQARNNAGSGADTNSTTVHASF